MSQHRSKQPGIELPSGTGLLLVGHGSRQPSGEFQQVVAMVAGATPQSAVEASYLEFETPTIADGFRRLVERGAQRVVVVPVMLFAADHVKRDIPVALAAVTAEFPHVTIDMVPHLGCHPLLLQLSQLRYDEALAKAPSVSNESSVLVIVGRGSRDEQATAEMHEFVRLRSQLTPVAQAITCFVAMARPTLDEALAAAIDLRPARIVVQPHLLFDGMLLTRIAGLVDRYATEHPQVSIVRTESLGPASLLTDAILDRTHVAAAS